MYGPYDVVWIGPCVWAGIIDELPPELVGHKVYLSIDNDEEARIKHMVNRFLGWKLPEDFSPDAGISFKKTFNEHLPSGPMKHEPIGTNLLHAGQAEAMIRYLLDGYVPPAVDKQPVKASLQVTGVYVEPNGTLSFKMDDGTQHVIPAHYKMPDDLDHATFVNVALANAVLHAHERIDAVIGSHDTTVKRLPSITRRGSWRPADPPTLRQRLKAKFDEILSIFN